MEVDTSSHILEYVSVARDVTAKRRDDEYCRHVNPPLVYKYSTWHVEGDRLEGVQRVDKTPSPQKGLRVLRRCYKAHFIDDVEFDTRGQKYNPSRR